MIKYDQGSFGFVVLFRLHGSALFKSVFPALISSIIYVALLYTTDITHNEILDDAYPMGALIAALTFLLAFRANNSHSRWWEAYTCVTNMQSKFLDVGTSLGAFHLQALKYENKKPPAFGEHPDIDFVERQRIRVKELSLEELEEQLQRFERAASVRSRIGKVGGFLGRVWTTAPSSSVPPTTRPKKRQKSSTTCKRIKVKSIAGKPSDTVILSRRTRGVWADGQHDPLFLEEAAHLLSLLSAVAFATLRNDVEGAESPLITFDPREPFPHVDPDDYKADIRKEFSGSRSRATQIFRYLLGISRTAINRTKYNAARPFRVIGGVSDSEVAMLQAARGPLAKVSLVSVWLQEFISREYLAGSMGNVASPIISRLHQFLSDGMLGYNQARKVAYVPFPFVHAQLTSFFVLIVVGFMPILMLAFINNSVFGFFLNILTVMCFTGLHEVARELENPFHNVPNEVPLNNFHAQYNHALLTMFCGYHPDAYWQFLPKESVVEMDGLDGDTDHPPQNPMDHRPSLVSSSATTSAASGMDGGAMMTATPITTPNTTNVTAHTSSMHSDDESSWRPSAPASTNNNARRATVTAPPPTSEFDPNRRNFL